MNKFCDHCGVRTNRRFCSPCSTRRIIYGEASVNTIQNLRDCGTWRKTLTRWRANDHEFMDYYWRAVAIATCKCGELVVDELQRATPRRGSFNLITSLSKSESHRGIVRRLALGRAALITNNYCPKNMSKVTTMRTWRAMTAHWLRRQGAGNRRPRKCRSTIQSLVQVVVKVEEEIKPFLKVVEKKAIKRKKISKNRKKDLRAVDNNNKI